MGTFHPSSFTKSGVTYLGHDLTSWRNLTKGILSDDILPKETKPKQVTQKVDKAEKLMGQLKTIIAHAGKEGKTEFQTRQMDDFTIEVSEDGIITNIDARATYYFGELDSDGGLPDSASDGKDKNIGNKIRDLKSNVQFTGGAYYGHNLTSWRNLTKGILSDDILPKETKKNKIIDKAEELVGQLKTIIAHAEKEDKTEFQTRKMNGTIEVSEDGIITNIDQRATYYFGELDSDGGLPDNASDRKDKNIGSKISVLKLTVQFTGGTYHGHELTSWRNLTKDILSDDILPKETKPKQVKKK
jgi:hypothetical protein